DRSGEAQFHLRFGGAGQTERNEMRTPPEFTRWMRVAALGGLFVGLLPSCKPAVQPPGPPKPATVKTNAPAAATNRVSAVYVSVFEDLMPPKGRDPFFPNSHRREPEP